MRATNHSALVDRLLSSQEPSVRWKTRVRLLGEERQSSSMRKLEAEIQASPRARALLQKVNGSRPMSTQVYAKWQGAQWVLMTLADLGYPRGDKRLQATADEMVDVWLAERFFREFVAESKADAYKKLRGGVPRMSGRHRTCASQQANALYSVLKLGLADDRIHALAERLLTWQWPDGGWNCDKDPAADSSTFIHTLWCMRALHAYAEESGSKDARRAVKRAAEVFLTRKLYKGAHRGNVIRDEFAKLHYPLYWHYDILGALKVFAEMGMVADARFGDALALLAEKEVPSGGWAAEGKYYTKVSDQIRLGADYVDWGGTSKKMMNEWVTVDALYVLKEFRKASA